MAENAEPGRPNKARLSQLPAEAGLVMSIRGSEAWHGSHHNHSGCGIGSMSDVGKNPKLCAKCGAPDSTFKCPCKQGYYCSKKCQSDDWKEHKKACAVALAKAVKDARRERGRDDPAVADARLEAGHALVVQGRYREAEKCFLEAQRVYLAAYGHQHVKIAHVGYELSQAYRALGRFRECDEILQDTIQLYRSTRGERSQQVAQCLDMMGKSLIQQNKLAEAHAKQKEALGIYKEVLGPEHVVVACLMDEMGICYRRQGRLDKACSIMTKALRIHRMTSGNNAHLAVSLENLGNVYSQQGMFEQARAHHEESLELNRRMYGEKHPSVGVSIHNLANVLERQGDWDEKIKLLKKALKIHRRAHGDNHAHVADALTSIATTLSENQGKHGEAIPIYEEALEAYNNALGIDCENTAKIHLNIALTKHSLGDMAGALKSAKESLRINTMHGVIEGIHKTARLVRELEGAR